MHNRHVSHSTNFYFLIHIFHELVHIGRRIQTHTDTSIIIIIRNGIREEI